MDSMSSDSEEKLKEDMEDDNENHDILKRQISSHPLYGLLVESHIDCLKDRTYSLLQKPVPPEPRGGSRTVGAIGELETMNESSYMKQKEKMASLGMLKQSELDHFMVKFQFVFT
ncbi:hypothetical protein TIFTF001_015258 [Ficus carica]|uniref:KNOX1 domain-containing protein n=1 Tax=Ficus carica TaxID=3494 RepID=A0AA87ZYD0_FICCA|nr:hypothetical protein TIFTF001_015258 [Ficus carica]